jgi:hypothetical protein
MPNPQDLDLRRLYTVNDHIGPDGRNFARAVDQTGLGAVREQTDLLSRFDKATTYAISRPWIPLGQICPNRGQVLQGVVSETTFI